MDTKLFLKAIDDIVKEKNISKDIIIEAMEQAMLTAYKKNFDQYTNARVSIDEEAGEIRIFSQKEIVEEPEDTFLEISIEEARELNPNYNIGDIVENEVTPDDFGRIAAQTAKQVAIQKIREAERVSIYQEFSNLEGEMVVGTLSREDNNNYYVDLGRSHAVLPKTEIIPGERLLMGSKIEIFLSKVEHKGKYPLLLATRVSNQVLRKLLEQEVPEIAEGLVEVFNVVRDPGSRSKVAVMSIDDSIDPIGACIGNRGIRIKNLIDKLHGEKLDVVKYSEDPVEFIINALSPAEVITVTVPNPDEKVAIVIVSDDQLSLAIGKKGQNARLAAKLTGWKIDIKSLESAQSEGVF